MSKVPRAITEVLATYWFLLLTLSTSLTAEGALSINSDNLLYESFPFLTPPFH